MSSIKNIHLIGIGGAGMSGIAEILHNQDYSVSGSDLEDTNVTKRLKNLGVKIFKGHKENNVLKIIPESQELGFVGIPNKINVEVIIDKIKND